jgi:2-amino-4-hydroxy-6-hydroxymethyldihydropteridine diphosphokinase
MHTVWLGLGSNIGHRERQLAAAVAGLQRLLQEPALSAVYESPPVGHVDQPDFLNMVVRGRTALPPAELLSAVKELERRLGRVPTFHMGPRSIDIDILLCDDVVLDAPGLRLPHPGLTRRAFVLVPLLELDPALRDPGDGTLLRDCLAQTDHAALRRVGAAADILPPTESPADD